jgi:hypothetical protein
MSYLEAQAAGGFLAAPVAHFQTNLLLRELSGAAIAAITTAINDAPATCKVIIVPLRGAVSRVSVADTAFALREAGYEIDMSGVWTTPAVKADVVRWLKASFEAAQENYPKIDKQKAVKFLGHDATCEGVLLRALAHANEHLGQMIAYARMNGVVPPWSK